MRKVTQLTVFVDNRPGTLAAVASILGNASVNIVDFLTGTAGAAGYVQVVVDDVAKAKDALTRSGYVYSEQQALYAEVGNTPGTLAELAGKLAAKGINIHSGYATAMVGDKTTSVILAVSDVESGATIV